MKYSKSERLAIGKRIYEGKISQRQAAIEYDVDLGTARGYMRLYRDTYHLPPKEYKPRKPDPVEAKPVCIDPDLEEYESMTREELIHELVRSRIREARLKKGYEVKGDGAEKVFIPLSSKSTK